MTDMLIRTLAVAVVVLLVGIAPIGATIIDFTEMRYLPFVGLVGAVWLLFSAIEMILTGMFAWWRSRSKEDDQ